MSGLEIAGIVSVVLNFITGIFARKQQNKARLLAPVIKGVEAAATPAVKRSIQNVATAAGVQAALHKEVKRITGAPIKGAFKPTPPAA
jgi:hypothetical protein